MKRYIILALTLCMTFLCMSVSAVAVSYDDIPYPENADSVVCVNWVLMEPPEEYRQYGDTVLVRFYVTDHDYSDDLKLVVPGDHYNGANSDLFAVDSFHCNFYSSHQLLSNGEVVMSDFRFIGTDYLDLSGMRFLTSKKPIYYNNYPDIVYFEPASDSVAILPTVTTADSMRGALGEVLGMVVIVVPVVVVLFGVRKGVAWLLACIKGT